jgi:hypothetical protein
VPTGACLTGRSRATGTDLRREHPAAAAVIADIDAGGTGLGLGREGAGHDPVRQGAEGAIRWRGAGTGGAGSEFAATARGGGVFISSRLWRSAAVFG